MAAKKDSFWRTVPIILGEALVLLMVPWFYYHETQDTPFPPWWSIVLVLSGLALISIAVFVAKRRWKLKPDETLGVLPDDEEK